MNDKLQLLSMLLKFQPFTFEHDVYYIAPKFCKKLHSWFFVQDDIRLAKNAITKFKKIIHNSEPTGTGDIDMIELLTYGMITIYGRCFTENKGHSRLPANIFEGHSDLQESHSKLMDLRNKAVAHREDTFRFAAALGLFRPHRDTQSYHFQLEYSRTIVNPKDLDGFSKLFEFIDVYVTKQFEKERDKVMSRIEKLTAEEWLSYRLDNYLHELTRTASSTDAMQNVNNRTNDYKISDNPIE